MNKIYLYTIKSYNEDWNSDDEKIKLEVYIHDIENKTIYERTIKGRTECEIFMFLNTLLKKEEKPPYSDMEW